MSDFDDASRESLPKRVAARPSPSQWGPDELLSLAEAALLFWPDGLLTERSLRTAARDSALAVVWIAGKIFTTPRAIADMTRCKTEKAAEMRRPKPALNPDTAPPPQPPALNEATQKLLDCLVEERARLRSRRNRCR